MKIIVFMFLPFMLMTAGCAKQKVLVKKVDSASMLHYSKLKGKDIKLEDMGKFIFFLNAGDTIPLNISINSNIVDKVDTKIDLTATQKIYFMIEMPEGINEENKNKLARKMKVYISQDAVNWAPIQNRKALKKIFGWDKGFLSFGFGITAEDGVFANVALGTTGGVPKEPGPPKTDEPTDEPAGDEIKDEPPVGSDITAEEMRYCETAEDCVPVGCKCSCSGCGGFSSEDIVNKKYEDLWYEKQGCEKYNVCPEVCCNPRKIVCKENKCGSESPHKIG